MPNYYVQNFTYDGPGDSRCYGKMGAHNHVVANQFTVDVTLYLTAAGATNIHAGNFRYDEPEPANGKEFRWNGNHWVIVL